MALGGLLDHLAGQVDARRAQAEPGQERGDVARPAAHVPHPGLAAADLADLFGEHGQQRPVQRLAPQFVAQRLGVGGRHGVVAGPGLIMGHEAHSSPSTSRVVPSRGAGATEGVEGVPPIRSAAWAGEVPSIRTPRSASTAISTAAQLIDVSARSNVHGKCGRLSQSTTCPRNGPGPRNSRSPRLPMAPPSSSPSAIVQARLRSLAWTIALGLLLGGAMGNLGDRLFRGPGPFRGQVVDWLNLPHFPWTFDLADTSISCAAVLIAVLALRGVRIDGTSPAHAADRIGGTPSTPSVAPAPRDGTTRLVDGDECAS